MFNIKELRQKKGISQTELANQIGVTIRTIQHWEKGSKNITIDKLDRINSYFELNMNIYNQNEENSKLFLVEEKKSIYKTTNETKIKKLEDKIKLQDEQLEFYKNQIKNLKKSNPKPDINK
jgi:transcriptional regulator with XRE-family HTH domain